MKLHLDHYRHRRDIKALKEIGRIHAGSAEAAPDAHRIGRERKRGFTSHKYTRLSGRHYRRRNLRSGSRDGLITLIDGKTGNLTMYSDRIPGL
jgi:hypothetical protein